MKEKRRKGDRISFIVMIVLIVLLLPVLIINLTLIIKGSMNRDMPPDIFGVAPMAVNSDSMNGDREDGFSKGALIFVKILDEKEKNLLKEGDIVTFRTSDTFVTHRIVDVFRNDENNAVSFVTQGDANEATDGAIPQENVIGKCIGSINGLGGFAMFMQTPTGILVFVGIPVLLYIAYDVIRIVLHNKRVKAENGTKLREQEDEIARLRALVENHGGEAEADDVEDEKIG